MKDPNHAFFDAAKAAQEQAAEDTAAQTQRQFEEAIVKQVLTAAGAVMGGYSAQVRHAFETTGEKHLGFAWFAQAYPGFPLTLGAARVPWAHDTTIWELLDFYTKTGIFAEYKKFLVLEGLDDTETPVAFVFRAKRRLLALHNWPRTGEMGDEPYNQGTRISHQRGHTIYTIERFPQLLGAIGNQWLDNS